MTRGPSAFTFVNLGPEHEFRAPAAAAAAGGPKGGTLRYAPLGKALSTPLSALTRRTHPLYAVARTVHAFEAAQASGKGRDMCGGGRASVERAGQVWRAGCMRLRRRRQVWRGRGECGGGEASVEEKGLAVIAGAGRWKAGRRRVDGGVWARASGGETLIGEGSSAVSDEPRDWSPA
eukprot:357763-Chlamydomonas_euryale.AAC.5